MAGGDSDKMDEPTLRVIFAGILARLEDMNDLQRMNAELTRDAIEATRANGIILSSIKAAIEDDRREKQRAYEQTQLLRDIKTVLGNGNGHGSAQPEPEKEDEDITFKWLVEKALAPVITAVVIAVLLYFLLPTK